MHLYLWLYRTGGDTDRHIVLYEYHPNRKAEHPKKFLKDFSGFLHTDGYKGCHALPKKHLLSWNVQLNK